MAADAHKDKDICKLMTATHMSPFDDEDFFGMAIVTVGSVPATLFAAFTIDWWGRRNVITCAFGMAFCGVAFLFLGMPLNVKMYCMAFVNAIMGAVFAAVWCYSREVYPTTYRSTASALFSLSARCGAILVPSVIQFCFQSGYHGLALSVLACAALMGVVSGLNLEVETSNMALDKIADQVQLGTSAASSETTESAGLLKSETKTAHSYTKA
jgi:MFS family permease